MPNDAKLGLVAGLAAVVLIAVFFFRKDPSAALPAATPALPSLPASPPQRTAPHGNPPVFPQPPTEPELPMNGASEMAESGGETR